MAAIVVEEIVSDLIARTDKLERSMQKAASNYDNRLGAMEKRSSVFANRIGAFIGTGAALAVARLGIQLADTAKQIDASLRLATASFGSFSQAQADAARIAQDTRNGLQETATLYARFLSAAKETGRSQALAARSTETFNKALKIGGAGAAEAASATLQFSQALASGALRGEEFNAIAEASPRILRLLADAMGVPIGQLKELAANGKITSDVLFSALSDRKFTDSIDAEFKQLPVTFDDAMTQVYNTAVTVFGAFDRGGEFSKALANFVTDGASSFGDLETAAEDFGIKVRSVFAGFAAIWDEVRSAGETAFNAIAETPGLSNIINRLREAGELAQKIVLGPAGGIINSGTFQRGRQAEADRLQREQNFRRITAMTDQWDPFFKPKEGTPGAAPGVNRAAIGGGGKGKLKTPKGKTVQSLEEWLNETAIEVQNEVFRDSRGNSVDPLDDGGRALDEAVRASDQRQQERMEDIEDQYDYERVQVADLADFYERAMSGAGGSIWETFKRYAIRTIAEIAARFTIAMANGQGGGDILGTLVSAGKAVFASQAPGARAIGGSMQPGRSYMVGERGPERISMGSTGGWVTPTSAMRGGGAGGVSVLSRPYFDLRNAVTTPELLRDINAAMQESERRAIDTAVSFSNRGFSERIDSWQKLEQ